MLKHAENFAAFIYTASIAAELLHITFDLHNVRFKMNSYISFQLISLLLILTSIGVDAKSLDRMLNSDLQTKLIVKPNYLSNSVPGFNQSDQSRIEQSKLKTNYTNLESNNKVNVSSDSSGKLTAKPDYVTAFDTVR